MPLPLLPTEDLDLTDLSRIGLTERLQYLFNQVRPQWRDFSIAYPENLILEGMGLLVSGAVENSRELVRQLSWSLVTDRLAAIRMGRPYGFEMGDAEAPTVTGVFTLAGGGTHTKDISIPVGTRAKAGSVIYRVAVAATLATGNTTVTALMENAEAQQESIQSTEESNWHVRLSYAPYIKDTIQVVAGNGTYSNRNVQGQKYQSFLEMTPDTLGFILIVDNYGYGHVLFGSSVYGAVPRGTVTISYKTGGGRTGAVSIGASWQILDSIYDVNGNPVNLVLTNAQASSAGDDQMSVEEARVRGPLGYRTLARTVNENDAEYAATTVAGVVRALCVTSEDDATVQEDSAYLYLVAEGAQYASGSFSPASPTATQISEVQDLLAEDGGFEALMGVDVTVLTGAFKDITVACKLYKASGYTAAQVKTNVTRSLQDFFAVADANGALNTRVDFGCRLIGADGNPDYTIAWSDVFDAIKDTVGVRKISPAVDGLLLGGNRSDVTLLAKEFPRLSTISLYDMDNGGILM
ncbi:MAG: baseplate J/gp47 family protein [Deltaproteobacteria bacterium]|nr:baseplate J/gp47 family protein [Deltaproteobacteria bacterium]